MVGRATHVSVEIPAKTIFSRPVALIVATKFSSSQAFMDDRLIGVCFANTARISEEAFFAPLCETIGCRHEILFRVEALNSFRPELVHSQP
jgi:hypothetical protein